MERPTPGSARGNHDWLRTASTSGHSVAISLITRPVHRRVRFVYSRKAHLGSKSHNGKVSSLSSLFHAGCVNLCAGQTGVH